MKLLNFRLCIACLGLLGLSPMLHAADSIFPGRSNHPFTQGRRKAAVQIVRVQGTDVSMFDKDSTELTPLADGQTIEEAEGKSIRTGRDSNARVVLSNGSTIQMGKNTEIHFPHYRQLSFSSGPTFGDIKQEPTHSRTDIELVTGGAFFNVNNISDSSEFTVLTDAAKVYVHGTRFVAHNGGGRGGARFFSVDNPITVYQREGSEPGRTIQAGHVIRMVYGRGPGGFMDRIATVDDAVGNEGLFAALGDATDLETADLATITALASVVQPSNRFSGPPLELLPFFRNDAHALSPAVSIGTL